MPVLLWTDGLFLLVLLAMGGFLAYVRRSEHFIRPWHSTITSRSARVSLVILLGFLLIGVADSLHFRPKGVSTQGELLSVLDYWLESPRTHTEKTYSAPLATHGYVREQVVDDQGLSLWTYPRLQYGGSHLRDPDKERGPDLLERAGWGALKAGGLIWPILALLQVMRRKNRVPGPAVLTFVLLCLLTGVVREWADQYHVLGTDKVGEDVLYQSLKSIRTGLMMGVLTTLATVPLALGLGVMAGYFRGWVDDVIQYLYTTLNAIPGVLLIAASMLIMQAYMARHEAQFASLAVRADFRLLALCLILGLTSWTGLCRLLRAETLKIREMDYVMAARALGVSTPRILLRHILPNVFHLVLISLVLDFSSLVLAEAVLSYVNIGVDPATYSWGNMINSARLEMAREPVVWWSLTAAFLFMFTLVLSANLFADAVRDAFDPRRN
ncbi:MAG: ABC transporter permease [Methylococcaceae bacterium]